MSSSPFDESGEIKDASDDNHLSVMLAEEY
jgi:hypothetical protein